MSVCDLSQKKCKPCEGGVPPMTESEIVSLLPTLVGWGLGADKKSIVRMFKFDDFEKTMKFVNAVAAMATVEDHHPDLRVGYNYCEVLYTTHAIGGLSENDVICAAKVNDIY